MSRYFPTPAFPDSMPVDISFVFADEKPAGKHGFMKPAGDCFRFEDGTKARFWGVNFNGGANFPEHEYAEKVARRIAQTGCNIVRFHQLDAEWDTPNIYAFTKGRRVTTTRQLDPVSLDRLDYLIHCLKEQGIYVYFDMMTYRKFKSGDGVPFAEELGDSAKPYSIFDRKLIELQKEFASQIWNHVNPYTGLAYKDDPVFAMTEITNECDLFTSYKMYRRTRVEYYERELRELLRDWLKEKGLDFDWENGELYPDEEDPMLLEFKTDVTRAYYKEMYDHMRALGVKIPITGTNWYHSHNANTPAERDMDFMDSHSYYYSWTWGETEKFVEARQINGARENILEWPASQNVNGMPYFMSEWDMPWPNPYRAEGPIYYAAVAALQDWTGAAIHTYAYGTRLDRYTLLGKEVSSSTIGGVPYREGIFSVWNDPAKFGLFYHCALILRRSDITPAVKKIGVRPTDVKTIRRQAWSDGLEIHNMKAVLPWTNTSDCDGVIDDTTPIPREDPDLLLSDNGQLWRDIPGKIAGIETPRTKAVYGKLTSGRVQYAESVKAGRGGLKVEGKTDFGVIIVSSLTDEPTETSPNMLLTTIGRAHNKNSVFDGDKMLAYGEPPIESEVIRAKISLRTERTDLKIWGVNPEGFYVGQIPAEFKDGWMSFTVGETMPANYYLIQAE